MFEYFNDLSSDELDELEDFVHARFFNKRKSLVKLFYYLKKLHPRINEENTSKKQLSINVDSHKRINQLKMRKLISTFEILFEQFIMMKQIDKNPALKNYFLLSALKERKMEKRFMLIYNKIKKAELTSFDKDMPVYLNLYLSELEYFNFIPQNDSILIAESIKRQSEYVDYFLSYITLESQQLINSSLFAFPEGIHIKENFKNEVMKFVEGNMEVIQKDHPNIYLYYISIRLFEEQDERLIEELQNYYDVNKKRFVGELLSAYFKLYYSFYNNKISFGSGDMEKYREILYGHVNDNFVKKNPAKEALQDGNIPHYCFISDVNLGLTMHKFSWVKKYIQKNRKYLQKEVSRDVYNLAMAKLNFGLKDYEKTLAHLGKVSKINFQYYFMGKMLQIRLYYENKNFRGLKYLSNNLLQYSKKSIKPKEPYRMFVHTFCKHITYLIRLRFLKTDNKNKAVDRARRLIDSEKYTLNSKDWFYEKVEELREK